MFKWNIIEALFIIDVIIIIFNNYKDISHFNLNLCIYLAIILLYVDKNTI